MNRRGSALLDLRDIDGDGKLDLLLGETWNDGPDGYNGFNWPDVASTCHVGMAWRRSGSLHPADEQAILVSADQGTVADSVLADVDGDGDCNALFSLNGQTRLFILENRGQGPLGPACRTRSFPRSRRRRR